MRWRITTVGHSQRTTPITIGGRVTTAQVSTAVDSGMVVGLMLS